MEPGDYVKIITDDGKYEGTLVPRPKMLEEGITVIKLESGYNIGIKNSKIKKTEKIKSYEKKETSLKPVKKNKSLPNVSILSFGGTISSKVDYKTGGAYADYTARDFVAMAPELLEIANISARKVMGIMSEDMGIKEWQEMARAIKKEIDSGVDGIVVTQGTDTLHFSSAAISFMVESPIPIVFTAAQRSIDRGSSDAFLNLICSVSAAANFKGAEVMTCLHGTSDDEYCLLIRGTKVRKMHTSRRDAFRPINSKPFAKVYANGIIELINENYKPRGKDTKIREGFEEKTALVYFYPNFDPFVIDYYIEKKYKGIVIAATALGHVATEGKKSLLAALKRAIKAGIVVVISSQTIYGSTHKYVYSNLRKLSIQLGCEFAGDAMPETAYIKLGWALGNTDNQKDARELFNQNVAGEFSAKSSFMDFLI